MEINKILRIIDELSNPYLILFNISFVYIGMLLGGGLSLRTMVFITMAFLSARTAGFMMNRYVGREYDLKNPKKANWESLKIPKSTVLFLFFIFSAIFIASAYELNTLALILTPVALAVFVIDPILKRYTPKRHYTIGIAESFDVAGGYIGATGMIPFSAPIYLLMFAIIFIGAGFDMLISVVQTDFDKQHGLKTAPSVHSIDYALQESLYSHVSASIFILAFALSTGKTVILGGAIVSIAILLLQHKGVDPTDDNDIRLRVFGYNGLAASVLLFSVAAALII